MQQTLESNDVVNIKPLVETNIIVDIIW